MFKQITLLKQSTFYENTTAGGCMQHVISIKPLNHIAVVSAIHTDKKNISKWGHVHPDIFIKMLKSNHHLYEIISDYPHKVYFDLDNGDVSELFSLEDQMSYTNNIVKIIESHFPISDIAISGSFTANKNSRHVILNNYLIHNEIEQNKLKQFVIFMKTKFKSFDPNVYQKK